MNRNRIVTGHDAAGNAKVMLSGPVPGDREFEYSPGFAAAVVWQTVPIPRIEPRAADAGASFTSVLPACGGTTAMVVTFPPDSVSASPGFDPQKAGAEFAARLPGLADSFEPDGSGYHRTESIDYGVVIEGEIWLDLGDGEGSCLRQGDVVVQVGTRHAWRNRSDRPARLFFVLIGAAK